MSTSHETNLPEQPDRAPAAQLAGSILMVGIVVGFLLLQPTLFALTESQDGRSWASAAWLLLWHNPLISLLWLFSLAFILGSFGLRQGREWGRRLVDLATWIITLVPVAWVSYSWAGLVVGSNLGFDYGWLPWKWHWTWAMMGLAGLLGIMVSVLIRQALRQPDILAYCGFPGQQSSASAPKPGWLKSFAAALLVIGIAAGLGAWSWHGRLSQVYSVAISPDGKLLAAGLQIKQFVIWDLATGKPLSIVSDPLAQEDSVAFSPDGRWLALTSSKGDVRVWEVRARRLRILSNTGFEQVPGTKASAVAFSPDGQVLAAGFPDIRLWQVGSYRLTRTIKTQAYFEQPVAFSPDGKFIASDAKGECIGIWETATGKSVATLSPKSEDTVDADRKLAVAFSPDGKFLAVGGFEPILTIWDLKRRVVVKSLPGHTQGISTLAYSPDGQLLASGSFDGAIKLWQPTTGALLRTLTGPTSYINSIAFSADSRLLASGSSDETIRLWQPTTGKCLRVIRGK
jgi:WD40 repeat protein